MNIGIFGMGYVGIVSAACLLKDGHSIIGVDNDEIKIKCLEQGKSPIKEPEIDSLIANGIKQKRFIATKEIDECINRSDMLWICVGTPSKFDGNIDLCYINSVIKDIGEVLQKSKNRPLIVIRSTCLPGTTEKHIIPLFEKISGLIVNKDIDIIFHPEFLREGTAIDDFNNPPKIVIGESYCGASDKLLEIYKNYHKIPIFRLKFGESEMVKYCDNIFHAVKITFANEVASIAKSLDIDARKVSEVYCSDRKLNISKAYLSPGFAYGGSCLPKDLRAITRFASLNFIQLPMLQSISDSNKKQIHNLIVKILDYKSDNVGMVGITFKEDTDDMRESPYVEVAKALIGEGINIKIYDKSVNLNDLTGSNKKQFQKVFRNNNKIFVKSLDELSSVDLILVNHSIVTKEMINMWLESNIKVIDLVNIEGLDSSMEGYEGIYW